MQDQGLAAIAAAVAAERLLAMTDMPAWPTYDTGNRSTMMLDVESHVEKDPGGNARRALDSLPPYEYNVDRNSVVHG